MADPEHFRIFTSQLAQATARIPKPYFQLPVVGREDPIYRERVYCYELYHNLRTDWPLPHLSFCGEVDKAGHPLIRGNELDAAKPDFIVHEPGTMDSNLVVVEVKPADVARADLQKDLLHLAAFRRYYEYAILLVYGGTLGQLNRIKETARSIAEGCELNRVSLDMIDLWWHASAGTAAAPQRWGIQ